MLWMCRAKSIERQNKIDRGAFTKICIELRSVLPARSMAYVSHRKCPRKANVLRKLPSTDLNFLLHRAHPHATTEEQS